MDYQQMHQTLTDNNYLCSEPFAAQVVAALATRPVAGAFLTGPAGTGKTYLPEVLGQVLETEYCFQQMYPGSREDDLLIKLIPDEHTPSGIKAIPGVVVDAIEALQAGGRAMLVLDEWDKARPSADAFLLDFLQHGRVRYNGYSARLTPDELSRLIVFITLNDERELSEPLLRRLPRIDFAPLPATLVRSALERTHGGHPHLEAAVRLYQLCCAAQLPKPATIQELRQLLDAITALGELADWDTLVYQFVTKSPESHALLARVEHYERVEWREERVRLDVSAYEREEPEEPEEPTAQPQLPRLPRPKPVAPRPEEPDLRVSAGIVVLSDRAYDSAVGRAGAPTDDPARIGSVAEVARAGGQDVISFHEPLPLISWKQAPWGESGEMLLVEPLATLDDVLSLRRRELRITKYSNSEIVGKTDGIELRWTPEAGAEVIVDMKHYQSFTYVFQPGEGYHDGSDSWLYVNSKSPNLSGLMVRRHAGHERPYRRDRSRDLNHAVTVPLGDGLRPAMVWLYSIGQREPANGDAVEVMAYIGLPSAGLGDKQEDMYLHPELVFSKRVQVGGTDLTYNWGYNSRWEGYNRVSRTFAGTTWAETSQAAATWAHEELAKLLVALRRRRAIVREA